MTGINYQIDFSTNAKVVQAQIADLARTLGSLEARSANLRTALDKNKATSRALTGDLRAAQSFKKLNEEINTLAKERTKILTRGYNFGAQDQFIKNTIEANEKLRIQQKILNDNATAMVNMGKNTQWAGRQLVVGFTVPLTILANTAVKAFTDIEKGIVKFRRVYGDAFTTTEELDNMSKAVKDLAQEWTKYGVAVSDTIDMAAQAAGAGFKGQELTAQVNAATKASVLGQLDMQKAMQATIALQSTFKLSSGELSQSINYLNQLENQTIVTLDDMTTAIPKAGTIIKGLGGSVKDLGTFMAALEEGGVSAAEGANALKSGLGSLLNPSKSAKDALSTIGVNMDKLWSEAEKNGKGVLFVVEQLATAMDNLGQTKRQQVMEELFGKHQFARMNALLQNINKGQQALTGKQVAGASQLEAAIVAQQELGKLSASNLTKFQAALEKLRASLAPVGEQVVKVLTPVVEFFTKLFEKFDKLPDSFKDIGTAIVIGVGVVAPVFLMLLGQIQNMIGNGMKLLNIFRGWGKDTKWVAVENMTLVETLQKIDSQLIAENALLKQNEAAWKARNIAAQTAATGGPRPPTGGGGAVPVPVPPRGGGGSSLSERIARARRGFASGGSVGGTGNKDTVPALLTPGEFVVNKEASARYSNILGAINAGTLPGYQRGRVVGMDPTTIQRSAEAKQAKAAAKMQGLTDEEAARAKQKAKTKLFAYKHMEDSVITGIFDYIVKSLPELTEFVNKFRVQARQWDQSHIGPSAYQTLKGAIDKTTGKPTKPWNYAGDLIMDNHLVNRNLHGKAQHPFTLGQARKYQHRQVKDPVEAIILSRFMNWRTSGGGTAFYTDLMDDNFLYMNLLGRNQKNITTQVKEAKGQGLNILRRATGGIVPGTGNKDTVPAMLTPGESVINKQSTKRFGGLLHAINNGTVKMLAGGYTKEVQGTALSDTEREALAAPFTQAIDNMVAQMSKLFNYGAERAVELRKQIELDMRNFDAAHVVREVDEQGNKIWRNENLVQVPKGENVKMEALTRADAQGKQRNLDVLDRTAMEMGIAMDKRTDLLERLTRQEHIVEQEQRDLLAAIVAEAEARRVAAIEAKKPLARNQMLSPAFRGESGAAFVGSLGVTPLNYATGKPMTRAEVDALKGGGGGGGKIVPTPGGPEGGLGGERAQAKINNAFATATTALMLFGSGVTGATDSLGAFGTILDKVTPALMAMSFLSPGAPGALAGKLGQFAGGRAGGKAFGLGALERPLGENPTKMAKFGRFARVGGAGVAGLGLGIGGNILGDKVGGIKGAGISGAATGAGIGMMFGPWGAAIGAATGGLIGLTKAYEDNRKAIIKANEAMMNASGRWDEIGKDIQTRFGLEAQPTWLDKFAGLQDQKTKEIYQEFGAIMKDASSPWGATIESIKTASDKGILTQDRVASELTNLTTKSREMGLDDKSIEAIGKAFIDALPEDMRQGYTAAGFKVQTNDELLKGIQTRLDTLAKQGPKEVIIPESARSKFMRWIGMGEGAGAALRPGIGARGPSVLNGPPPETIDLNANAVGMAAADLAGHINSLQTSLGNLEVGTDEYTKVQKELERATKYSTEAFSKDAMARMSPERIAAIETATSKQTLAMIGEEGRSGITKDDWATILQRSSENAIDLNASAQVLLQAGVSLRDASGELKTAGQIIEQGKIEAALGVAKGEEDKYKALVEQNKKDREALSEIETNKAKELKDRSVEIKLDKESIEMDKLEANLEIKRIDLEMGAMADFSKRFNKAFGTSIDSFADAQYQIDKIGSKIRSIQLHRIAPLQEKNDDMNRSNELAQREIEKLEKKKADRAEKTAKVYEKQADILEELNKKNQRLLNQQQSMFDFASAIAQGDVGAAVNAQLDMIRQENEAALEDQQKVAEQQKTAEVAAPEDARINELKGEIDKRNENIQKNEDKIYEINDKIVEPLQRRADLMSDMLTNTQLELKYQQDNIAGVDAQKQALNRAKLSALQNLNAANHRKTVEDEIKQRYEDQATLIAQNNGLTTEGIKNTKTALDELWRGNTAHLDAAQAAVKHYGDQLKAAISGEGFTPEKGTIWDIMDRTLNYIEGKEPGSTATPPWMRPENKGTPVPGSGTGTSFTNRTGAGRWERQARGGRARGGPTLLTPGEFVMSRSAVDEYGVNALGALNRGGKLAPTPKEYAAGGTVKGAGRPYYDAMTAAATKLSKSNVFAQAVEASLNVPTPPGGGGGGGLLGPPARTGIPPTGPHQFITGGVRMIKELHELHAALTRMTSLITGYGSRPSPLNHGHGRAMDMMVPQNPVSKDNPAWKIANWIRDNYKQYKVTEIIFQDHIWTPSEGWHGYRNSQGGNDTQRHLNHIHVSAGQGSGSNGPYDDSVPRWYSSEYWAKQKKKRKGWAPDYKATGGAIPGSGGRDSVPAMLTPGEFVMRKSAVDRIGANKLAALNRGPSKFAGGGVVGQTVLGTGAELLQQGETDNLPDSDELEGNGKNGETPKGSSKKFGRFWAVTSDTKIKGGLYYANGDLHAEPWIKGKTKKADAGVADIGTARTKVYALLPGTVTRLKKDVQAFGPNNVVLTHDGGAETRYAHMDLPAVGMGDKVEGGQYLGAAAVKSRSVTFPGEHSSHLHFAWHGIPELPQPGRNGPVPWAGFTNKFKGGIVMAARGGLIPGSGGQDTVRAALTPGEFVINKNAVKSIGIAPLKSLNQSQTLSRGPIMPNKTEGDSAGGDVYNEYNLQFNILEATDADEVANTVMYKLERATRSKMRTTNVR